MPKSRKRFGRVIEARYYRKVFHLFSEGEKTEPSYFEMLKQDSDNAIINIYSSKRTAAKQLFQKVLNFISKEKPSSLDNIWIILDLDANNKIDIKKILEWAKKKENYGVALSNPKFEYWLLLHFEKGNNLHSVEALNNRLEKYLPNYSKNNLDTKKLLLNMDTAIKNAKQKFKQCQDQFIDHHSSVFILIEKILEN